MRCTCGNTKLRRIEMESARRISLTDKELGQRRARRECVVCGKQWMTAEVAQEELQRLRVAAYHLNLSRAKGTP